MFVGHNLKCNFLEISIQITIVNSLKIGILPQKIFQLNMKTTFNYI